MKKISGSSVAHLVVLGVLTVLLGWLVISTLNTADADVPRTAAAVETCTVADGADRPTAVADDIVGDPNGADRYDVARAIYEAVLRDTPDNVCAGRGLTVLDDKEAALPPAAMSWAEQVETSWKSFAKHYVTPLGAPLGVAVGLLALLLVLSRLLTGWVVGPDVLSPAEEDRRPAWWVGCGYLTLAALAAAMGSGPLVDEAGVDDKGAAALAWALLWTVLASFGVLMLSWARGTALALQVEVLDDDGATNALKTKRLVLALTQLGSSRPRGLNTFGGSDLTKLPDDALTDVPTGAAAKAAFTLLRLVRPLPPWRLTVLSGDGSGGTATMTRNGRVVDDGMLVVNRIDFASEKAAKGSDDKSAPPTAVEPSDRLVLAAAAQALIVLSKRHAVLKPGLAGADRWQGLALFAMAMTPGVAADDFGDLLRRAVDASPRYALARLALAISQDTKTAAQWAKFAGDLENLQQVFAHQGPDGYEAFRVRLSYNRCVAWSNVCAFAAESDAKRAAWLKSETASSDLEAAVAGIDRGSDPKLKIFLDDIRPLVTCVLANIDAHDPDAPKGAAEVRADNELTTPEKADELYAYACLFADLEDGSGTDVALEYLESAVRAKPSLKDDAIVDSSFGRFRGPGVDVERRRKFQALVGEEAPADYLQLLLFEPQADAIEKLGFTELAQLLGATPKELATATGVHRTTAARWRDAARLDEAAPWKSAKGDGLAWLGLFLAVGVDSPEAFDAKGVDAAGFLAALQKEAVSTQLVVVADETTAVWWPSTPQTP